MPPPRPARLKDLGELAQLRDTLVERERQRQLAVREAAARRVREERIANEFRDAMNGVQPLHPHGRAVHVPKAHAPQPTQRLRDEQEVLVEALSDEIDATTLLDTDDALSYRAPGIGPEVLRRLRRGEWSIQAHIDLHGHRVDEARHALVLFLKHALRNGLRCVRVVHGKGLGSRDRVPVLKGKVRGWLVQREEVIAFCQARPIDGGAGALVVLLRPGQPAPA
jgi:DNA-nicking Smr family endonuclease